MFASWVYLVAAAAIMLAAVGIGQIMPGFGVTFVALATTMWTAYCVSRQRRSR